MMHVHFYIRLLADILYDDVVFTNEEIRVSYQRVSYLFLTHFLLLDLDFRKFFCIVKQHNKMGTMLSLNPWKAGEVFIGLVRSCLSCPCDGIWCYIYVCVSMYVIYLDGKIISKQRPIFVSFSQCSAQHRSSNNKWAYSTVWHRTREQRASMVFQWIQTPNQLNLDYLGPIKSQHLLSTCMTGTLLDTRDSKLNKVWSLTFLH